MAELRELDTFSNQRGSLTVIQKPDIPFDIKRIYYIYDVDNSDRGGHRHKVTRQVLICLSGSCEILNNNGRKKEVFVLDNPRLSLIVEPEDWHILTKFSADAMLLVLASELYDEQDYIYEDYK